MSALLYYGDSHQQLKRCAKCGTQLLFGRARITLMPDVMIKEFIASGDLVRVLPNWSANPRDIYMLYNHKDHLPEKVRLFIDYVIAYHIH